MFSNYYDTNNQEFNIINIESFLLICLNYNFFLNKKIDSIIG